jgi:hypothetical protein
VPAAKHIAPLQRVLEVGRLEIADLTRGEEADILVVDQLTCVSRTERLSCAGR